MEDSDVFFVMYEMNYFIPKLDPPFSETVAELQHIPADSNEHRYAQSVVHFLRAEMERL